MPEGDRPSLAVRIWRSVFRTSLRPETERERKRIVLDHLVLHLRPVRVPARTLPFTHTFGLGGMSAVLVLTLILSGVLLMFVYEPTPDRAYGSILRLEEEIRFGGFVRGIHHWSANFLIVVVFLHTLRTFFTGAFHGTRQFNWVIGIVLLLGVVAANFTGYLLPWDQLSYWAITIVTGMLGYVPLVGEWLQRAARAGTEIGASTLILFYTFHTTVLPVLLVALMAFHFWRVRKARGVVVPYPFGEEPEPKPATTLFVPDLLVREFSVALVLTAVVMVTALLFEAGLGAPANPGMSPNPAKAPWYFMGLQELLLHFDPLFAIVLLPLAGLVALVAIPYLNYESIQEGPWFLTLRGRNTAATAAGISFVATVLWVLLDEFVLDFGGWMPWLPGVVSEGIVPVSIGLALLAGLLGWLKRSTGATRNELVQAAFSALVTAFIVLTVTGIWFRGAGMALVWPWNR
ncbi:MAG: cytochrome b N-terminal domain-containing protein [marine benthic group bacterium]|nr:cytochrome b N-terminal domain-containing protein [Gemmatimonadota bacterium]